MCHTSIDSSKTGFIFGHLAWDPCLKNVQNVTDIQGEQRILGVARDGVIFQRALCEFLQLI